METVTHHGTPYSPWDYLGTAMVAPYPQTTELGGEAHAMDSPSLCSEEYLEDTTTNPDIPAPTKVCDQPGGLPLLILTPQSTPILSSQSQHIPGHTQQKHSAPHCLPPVTPTDQAPVIDPMIQIMTHHIKYHKHLMCLIL